MRMVDISQRQRQDVVQRCLHHLHDALPLHRGLHPGPRPPDRGGAGRGRLLCLHLPRLCLLHLSELTSSPLLQLNFNLNLSKSCYGVGPAQSPTPTNINNPDSAELFLGSMWSDQ